MNPRRDSKGLEKTRKGSVKGHEDTEVFHKRALESNQSALVHQLLVLFILSIPMFNDAANRISETWPLPIG